MRYIKLFENFNEDEVRKLISDYEDVKSLKHDSELIDSIHTNRIEFSDDKDLLFRGFNNHFYYKIVDKLVETDTQEEPTKHNKFRTMSPDEKIYDFANDPKFHNLFYSEKWSKEDLKLLKTVLNDKESYVLLYHGTDCDHLIMDQGIKRTKNSTKRSLQSETGYVYLSVYPNMAKTFGEVGYAGKKACVYQVFVKIKDLKPDHDQLRNKRYWSKDPSIGNRLIDSLLYGHGARVKRDILPYEIKKIQ